MKAVWTGMVLILALAVAGCSDGGDGDGGSGKKGRKGRIDLNGFTNTETPDGFRSKADSATDYFASFKNLKTQFASGAGNGLTDLAVRLIQEDGDSEETCTLVDSEMKDINGRPHRVDTYLCLETRAGDPVKCIKTETVSLELDAVVSLAYDCASGADMTEPQPHDPQDRGDDPLSGDDPQTIPGADSYVPDFDDVETCDEAFNEFESLYAQTEQEYRNLLAMLKEPNQFHLAGETSQASGALREAETDSKSAIVYEIESPADAEGIKMKGYIKGGANDRLVVLEQKFDVEMDFSKIFAPAPQDPFMPSEQPGSQMSGLVLKNSQAHTFAIDSEARLIEMNGDMTFAMSGNDAHMLTKAVGRIALSDGEEKFIEQDMKLAIEVNGEKTAMDVVASARVVDENTIDFKATLNGKGEFAFKIVRTEGGQCEVKDFVSTIEKTETTRKPKM